MNKLPIVLVITAILLSVVFFDQIVVFLLSGFIPGVDFAIPATTMLAVMVASVILALTLRRRDAVYHGCLELYDEFFSKKKKDAATTPRKKSDLPHRRYQEL